MAFFTFALTALISIAISVVLTVAKMLLTPKPRKPETAVPKPEDGKYNFKQNVPHLSRVYGRVKKPGDYVLLEENSGAAFHVMVWAGHRIEGYVTHYLHDEAVTLTGDYTSSAVIGPDHFYKDWGGGLFQYITMAWRVGLSLETAYPGVVSNFPSFWTNDHRGDGLATTFWAFQSVGSKNWQNVYPQGMPNWSAVGDGAWVYDPRTNQDPDDPTTWSFSTNLALIRLDHLTHVSGFRLSKDDMYMPDWESAADICDQVVENRDEEEEPRYHGGLWYRYENDPVEIGNLIDEAGELVIYERGDGTIGVHAGVMVTPDIRITSDDMIAFSIDANQRGANTVSAVRGRFTDPDATYNTVDAAIYGDPYTGDDTQRTKTVDNQAVQYHNHMQRLQKLAFTRANAARVSITVPFDATGTTRYIRERRFIRVHRPERGLDEAIVEIAGRPKLSLRDLTYTFDGIVVPSTLYSFDAATEEGQPGTIGAASTPGVVPVPDNFAIGIASEVLAAGQPSAYGVASWDHVSDALTYELEFQLSDASEPPQSVISELYETELRTPPLRDGFEYRFRLRTLSHGATSDWTSYETETATADTVAPDAPTGFSSTPSGSDVTLDWVNPNSPNLYRTVLYRGGTSSFGAAVAIYTANGGIGEARSYIDQALASGDYWWWVRSFNASGVASTEVGPETQTII
jgi:hypothetical protein